MTRAELLARATADRPAYAALLEGWRSHAAHLSLAEQSEGNERGNEGVEVFLLSKIVANLDELIATLGE